MQVLLIVPTHLYKYAYPSFLSLADFPTGFAYIASALKNAGHEVFGLNLNNIIGYRTAYEMVYDRIRLSMQSVQPELIGLGGLCTDFTFLKDTIQVIRKLRPNIPIICGGGIVNNDAEFIFNTLRPDFCLIGEGEEVIIQLANMLESGRQDYEGIANLGYWENGTAKFTKQDFNYIDIDKRSSPDYEPFGVDDMLDNYSMAARYLYRYTRPNPRPMTIVTARGCPFNCTFCVHQRGPRYRARSVENIIQEIKFLYERYNFNILIILDELFAVNRLRMKKFCNAFLEAQKIWGWDFDWFFQTHASSSLDREILELAKKTGCYFFSYGLESASPRVLESMNKKTKPAQIIEAIKIANSVGIGFGGNFIFGDVAETEETVCESMDFFSRYCLDIHSYFNFIRPYPGSELFDKCIKKGIIRNKLAFYERIDELIWNMTSMPDRLWLLWLYLMYYLSASLSWAKSTEAFSWEEEKETSANPIILYSGKQIYKVWAKCPHCAMDVYYRDFLGNIKKIRDDKKEEIFSLFLAFRKLILEIRSLFRNRTSRIFLKICKENNVLCYFLVFRQRLFKLLKTILADEKGIPFFVTGCPHCNKRIKIYVPGIKDTRSQFEFIVKRLLFKCI